MILATLVLAAAFPARAAVTVRAYDGSFDVDIPSSLQEVPADAFKDRPASTKPFLALRTPGAAGMPVLLVMKTNGTDAKAVAQKELESFMAHNRRNPNFKPTKVQAALLSEGFHGYWFSNGRKALEYTFTYFTFSGKVLKAGCPAARREECQAILGTIRVPEKSEAENG